MLSFSYINSVPDISDQPPQVYFIKGKTMQTFFPMSLSDILSVKIYWCNWQSYYANHTDKLYIFGRSESERFLTEILCC
jgi:hypothetical protein